MKACMWLYRLLYFRLTAATSVIAMSLLQAVSSKSLHPFPFDVALPLFAGVPPFVAHEVVPCFVAPPVALPLFVAAA